MCGINGILGEQNPALIRRMNRSLVHRGPDDEGVYSGSGATLGMRRLSIIDLEGGHQPIRNESGSLQIVFNGEIYNYLELRKGLETRGHRFSTQTDTEVILHLYEEKGTETPGLLRGDFAFAIWDEDKKKGFVARDHLGVKPLYYTAFDQKVLFSSELKGVLQDERLSLELDPEALDLYLTFLYIPHPWTIYKNIHKLEAGSYLEYERGEFRVARYWKPPHEQRHLADGREFDEQIYQRLQESVAVRLMSDVPLGAFLSGGIDSTAIVALMSRASSQPVRTFSVGYSDEYAAFNELEFGRLASDYYGTRHHELIVEPNIQETIREVVEALDEPFGDSSAVPTYLVSQATASEVKVVLSGVGGDELFGGYPRYLGALWEAWYRKLPLATRRLLSGLADWTPEIESSRNVGGWIRRFLSHPEDAPSDRYRRWVSFNSGAERRGLYTKEFFNRLTCPDRDEIYFSGLFLPVQNRELVEQAMYVDLMSYLVNDLFLMADQMGMFHSLEIRVPLCDHRLAEDLIQRPWQRKIGPFTLKKLMKRILRKELPPEILKRKKQGFMIPVGLWMKKELRPMLEHYFSEDRLRRQSIFDPQQVKRLLQAHISGKARNTNQLWGLLIFQLWHERMERRLVS